MRFWKHEDSLRYDTCIYGGVDEFICKFNEPPEASFKHIERRVLKPLMLKITKKIPKNKLKRIDVKITCYSTMTMFDCTSFSSTASEMRQYLDKNLCKVGAWTYQTNDQRPDSAIEFEVRILGG